MNGLNCFCSCVGCLHVVSDCKWFNNLFNVLRICNKLLWANNDPSGLLQVSLTVSKQAELRSKSISIEMSPLSIARTMWTAITVSVEWSLRYADWWTSSRWYWLAMKIKFINDQVLHKFLRQNLVCDRLEIQNQKLNKVSNYQSITWFRKYNRN